MANDSYKAQKVTRSFQLSVMVKARFLLTFLIFLQPSVNCHLIKIDIC